MFGKLMSISDTLMWRYIDLLSFKTPVEIQQWQQAVAEGANPRDIKVEFAQEIVERFHNQSAAVQAYENFVARFQQGQMPEEMPEVVVTVASAAIPITQLLKEAGLTSSTSEAIRMIQQGAVKIDGERVSDRALQIPVTSNHVYQVGKRRFARVKINTSG
jgi:tyrosyl-tRNA synthetase